jgi:integrase
MKPVPGIEPRHARSCPVRGWESCKCKPSYQAHVWSKRDNKRIRRTFPTLAAAKSWRLDAMKGLRDGKLRAPTPETVREAGAALIAGMEDGSIRDRSGKRYKPSTIRSYKASLENHIYPEFGGCKLSTITYPDLQNFVDRLAAEGLDGSTIRNTVNPLRVIFKKHRYSIPVNPTTGLEIIARENKPKRVVPPNVAARMLKALTLEDRAIWASDFYAGLRFGELQGLRIEDVELFDGWGLLHVRQGWDKVEGAIDPKSTAGTRKVPMPKPLYEVLDEYLVRLDRRLDRTEGLAFGRSATEPFAYTTVRGRAKKAWGRAGLEPSDFEFHEGRHSYSSFLAAAGIPKERRDRYLGHADHSMDGRYTHQLDPSYLDDAQTLSEYLRRADTPMRLEQVRDSRATVRDSS